MNIKIAKTNEIFDFESKAERFCDSHEDCVICPLFNYDCAEILKGSKECNIIEDWFSVNYEKEIRKITKKQINDIYSKSTKKIETVFGKCTIVTIQLENGFILSEISACVEESNYDKAMGLARI